MFFVFAFVVTALLARLVERLVVGERRAFEAESHRELRRELRFVPGHRVKEARDERGHEPDELTRRVRVVVDDVLRRLHREDREHAGNERRDLRAQAQPRIRYRLRDAQREADRHQQQAAADQQVTICVERQTAALIVVAPELEDEPQKAVSDDERVEDLPAEFLVLAVPEQQNEQPKTDERLVDLRGMNRERRVLQVQALGGFVVDVATRALIEVVRECG